MSLNDISTAIDQDFVTKDFHFNQLENYKRWTQIEFLASGNNLDLFYSIDFGLTWIQINKNASTTTFALTSTLTRFDGYFDVKSDYIRFRFRNNTAGESYRLRQFTIEGNIVEELST